MNEPMNPVPPRPRVKVPPPQFCECGDPGCACGGHCRRPAKTTVFRIDMEDQTGTPMCALCAQDAENSGVFYTKESTGHILVDLMLEWDDSQGTPFDAMRLAPFIRYEMRRLKDYQKAKEAVLANIAADPHHYDGIVTEALKPMAKVKATPWEKAAGRKVEKEHTTSAKTADTIASHHLKERPDYYRKLKQAGLADEIKKSVEPLKEPPGSPADLKV